MLVGTLVQVGDAWRVIDLPQPMVEGQAESPTSGLFFAAVLPLRNDAGGNAPSETLQKLLAALESLDREASTAGTPADQARFTARRAELLEQIAAAAKTADERGVWLRQLADMLSAGAQSRTFPDGIERLKALLEKLESRNADKNLIAYIKFRQLTTSYVLSMQAAQADTAKIQAIQAKWLKTLENFAVDYPGGAGLGRGHAATGHQPGVQRAGGRGEAVVRADRRRVPRCARGPESGRRPEAARLRRPGH